MRVHETQPATNMVSRLTASLRVGPLKILRTRLTKAWSSLEVEFGDVGPQGGGPRGTGAEWRPAGLVEPEQDGVPPLVRCQT